MGEANRYPTNFRNPNLSIGTGIEIVINRTADHPRIYDFLRIGLRSEQSNRATY